MKAMRLHEIGKFTLDEVEVPEPQGREILVKVDACGICGSDIPRVYELGTKVYPVTLGHEYVGTVVSVGNDEDQELIGKTGAVYPVVPCMECPSCRIGQYAQCESYKTWVPEQTAALPSTVCFHLGNTLYFLKIQGFPQNSWHLWSLPVWLSMRSARGRSKAGIRQ